MSGSVVTRYSSIPMRRRIIAGEIPPMIAKHKRRDYILACYKSMPEWCDRNEMRRLEALAARLSLQTGVPHELNHIVPITHPNVCGLTVPWNMEIITRYQNNKISNCFDLRDPQEQACLFVERKQHQLNL